MHISSRMELFFKPNTLEYMVVGCTSITTIAARHLELETQLQGKQAMPREIHVY